MGDAGASVEPFFLPVEPGVRFCLFHRPAAGVPMQGGILYVHPFAEEMNKSRRMAALQSRALASLGFGVLQMDLWGCGDSSGVIRDASVSRWLADIECAAEWMQRNTCTPLVAWGLRFGGLLVIEWARKTRIALEQIALWQPVASGETHLAQFLRIGLASEMLTAGGADGTGTSARKRLTSGETVEVAGYEITPALAKEMDQMRLAGDVPAAVPISWLEVAAAPAVDLTPASKRIIQQWQDRGAKVSAHVVNGNPFWATVEIAECPALIEATTRLASEQWTQVSTSAP